MPFGEEHCCHAQQTGRRLLTGERDRGPVGAGARRDHYRADRKDADSTIAVRPLSFTLIVNPGSVGCPAYFDPNPISMYPQPAVLMRAMHSWTSDLAAGLSS